MSGILEVLMTPRYDLFKMDEGSPIWFGAAETMEDVKTQVQQARVDSNTTWIVLDQLTGDKKVVTPE
jgi:hypothetical protein